MASKTALVFGGSRGIGKATVEVLRAKGWKVAYTYAANGGGEGAIKADVREPPEVEAAFVTAREMLGGIGAVVANAGINVPGKPLADFPAENMRALVETNIIGAFNVLQAAARHVEDGGSIVGLTTSLIRHALPGVGPYVASKAAVEALLRSLARELAPRGVRVNGVAPGPVDTDLFRAGKDEATIARMGAMSPFNRVGRPEEVAAAIAFVLSDEASWVAGQFIQPNGGLV